MQVFLLTKRAEFSANKNLNGVVRHLFMDGRLVNRKREKEGVCTYVFPFTSDPSVMCAFCRLAWPDNGKTLLSIT